MRRSLLLLLAALAANPALARQPVPNQQAEPVEPGRQLTPRALVAHPGGSSADAVAAVRATPWGRHERARRTKRLGNARTRCVTRQVEQTQAGPASGRGCKEPGGR